MEEVSFFCARFMALKGGKRTLYHLLRAEWDLSVSISNYLDPPLPLENIFLRVIPIQEVVFLFYPFDSSDTVDLATWILLFPSSKQCRHHHVVPHI